MSAQTVRLVLRDIEAEVLEEALGLYLAARPTAADKRFDYRYRAARSVLTSLLQRGNDVTDEQTDDDQPATDEGPWERRRPGSLED
jgi:hypothetical protein